MRTWYRRLSGGEKKALVQDTERLLAEGVIPRIGAEAARAAALLLAAAVRVAYPSPA